MHVNTKKKVYEHQEKYIKAVYGHPYTIHAHTSKYVYYII